MQVIPIEFGTPEYDDAVRLRYEVLRRPLGLQFTAEQLATEYADHHLGIYDDSLSLLGYLCFTPVDDTTFKMRQVAVEPALQGKGVGSILVVASEKYAIEKGIRKIVLHARDTAVPFYLKLLYTVVGEPFEEVGIPHSKMEKTIQNAV